MKIFYTASDIEELAASGITRLELGPGVALTDVARELAEELGISLVAPGATLPEATGPTTNHVADILGAKPKGCQHEPLTGKPASGANATTDAGSSDSIVNKLVDAVSRLANQGE